MDSALSVVLLGFLLGVRHATDADHVVAISTMVARDRSLRSAAKIGAVWGLGHTITIVLVGGALIAFGVALPPRVGLALELAVAVMLLALGGLNVATTLRRTPHAHAHEHGRDRSLRSLAIGSVHGLAGSAAIALVVVAKMKSLPTAIAYLLVFGCGTVAGMMLLTSLMALPMKAASTRFVSLGRHLGWASGVVSIGLGLVLAYQVGVVDGLFTGTAHWTPR